jgi:hypothetical protein
MEINPNQKHSEERLLASEEFIVLEYEFRKRISFL